jgi:glycerol-3-phosphate dehydrogenase
VADVPRLIRELKIRHPFLTDYTCRRLIRAYGTEAATLLGNASPTPIWAVPSALV